MTPSSGEDLVLQREAQRYRGDEPARSRTFLRNWMIGIFVGLNVATIGLVYWAYCNDTQAPMGTPRLVTDRVLMTMLGATAVQVGSAMLMIVRFFFKGDSTSQPIEFLEE